MRITKKGKMVKPRNTKALKKKDKTAKVNKFPNLVTDKSKTGE